MVPQSRSLLEVLAEILNVQSNHGKRHPLAVILALTLCWTSLKSTIDAGRKRMLSCYDVAQYFLAKADADAGDLMSNLKLQKLVYYAQGFALALLDKPFFPQCIELG
jgi:hypothetical protein